MAANVIQKIRLGIYDLGLGGGSTRYLNDLLAGIPRDRFELVFFPEGTSAGQGLTATSNAGDTSHHSVTTSPPPNWGGRLWRRMPKSIRLAIGLFRNTLNLRRQFKRRPVDILHTNYAGFEESAIAARWAGIKTIIGTYNVLPPPEYITARWLQNFVEWLGGRCLRVAIAGAHQIGVEWGARHPVLQDRFVDIPWGIDVAKVEVNAAPACTREELKLPSDAPLLAIAARLHPMKGISYLLQSLPAILNRFPKTILLIIGDGPERADLEKLAIDLAITEHVRFLGWRQDSLRIVALADLVVLSSVYLETWGSALAEAMVLRKPVVATRIGGVPELVADGETGLIVPCRDTAAVAGAICRVLDSTELSHSLGEAGRQRVERVFPIEKMQRETVALYDRLCQAAQ